MFSLTSVGCIVQTNNNIPLGLVVENANSITGDPTSSAFGDAGIFEPEPYGSLVPDVIIDGVRLGGLVTYFYPSTSGYVLALEFVAPLQLYQLTVSVGGYSVILAGIAGNADYSANAQDPLDPQYAELQSIYNYFLANHGVPITDFTVEIATDFFAEKLLTYNPVHYLRSNDPTDKGKNLGSSSKMFTVPDLGYNQLPPFRNFGRVMGSKEQGNAIKIGGANYNVTDTCTVGLLFYVDDAVDYGDQGGAIISVGGTASANQTANHTFVLQYRRPSIDEEPVFRVTAESGRGRNAITTFDEVVIQKQQVYFIVVTRDYLNENLLKFYVNGTLVQSIPTPDRDPDGGSFTDLRFFGDRDRSGTTINMYGQDFFIIHSALTPENIEGLYDLMEIKQP
jgi:hypothetical protein